MPIEDALRTVQLARIGWHLEPGAFSPGVLSSSYSYDSNGRLTDVDQGSRNTHTTYDADGYVQSVRDALNRTTSFTYDDAGRVRTQTLPDSRVLNFDYDANGNLTSITPPGRPGHLFGHDLVDRTTSYDPPDVGLPADQTSFAYNLDHQVELVTRPDGQTIDPVYGATTGRLESVATPRGSYVYGYEPLSGNLVSVSDPDGGALAFAYDGSLPTSVTWSGALAGSVAFAYNANFEPTSRTLDGGDPLVLDYNLDGQLTTAGAMTLSYAGTTGFFTGSTLQDTTDALTYTTYGELDTFAGRQGGSTLYSFDLGRDAGGRITQKSETIEGATSLWEYRYDTAGRLDEVKKDGAVVATYGYDSNSNRTSWTDFWGSGSATYDVQDRLLTSGPRSYTYSANGELATKTNGSDVTTYGYDVFGNLRTVELPTGVAIEYLIDAANRRIGKRVNDTLVSGFLWQSQLRPAAELDGSGAIVSEFVYGTKGNVPDYVVKGETTYRIFTDHLGSVRLVLNAATGAVAQRIDYDAFGRILLDTNPGFQPFGFAGGLYDPQTGLTRFGARDYDPESGRWTSKDPIGFAGGDSNLYGYVVNDPINLVDRDGRIWGAVLKLINIVGTIRDLIELYDVLVDPCVSGADKAKALGQFGLGFINPLDAIRDIGNLLGFARGAEKSWTTAKRAAWRELSPDGAVPMREVLVRDRKTGQVYRRTESMELHHRQARRNGGSHDVGNLDPAWPNDHEMLDPYRHTGYDVIEVIDGE